MMKKLAVALAISALGISSLAQAAETHIPHPSIFKALSQQKIAIQTMDDAAMAKAKGTYLEYQDWGYILPTYATSVAKPYASDWGPGSGKVAGHAEHMVKYRGFGTVNDYRSYAYFGVSYLPLDYGRMQDPSGSQFLVTGDTWMADMNSDAPGEWARANARLREIHVVVVNPYTQKEYAADASVANPSTAQLAGFTWKTWNRPMTLLKW